MKKTWKITLADKEYKIQYQSGKPSDFVKVSINGEVKEYIPTLVKSVGNFAKLGIADQDVVLKLSLDGKTASLLVDGRNIDGQEASQPSHNLSRPTGRLNNRPTGRPGRGPTNAIQRKIGNGLVSYVIFVGFTYVNLILLSLNINMSFPFSAMMPQIPVYVGQQMYIEEGVLSSLIVGVALSLAFASIYLLLYFLSRNRLRPLLITIVFIGIDTLVLFFLSLENIGSSLIDFAFHVWVLFTLINLYKARVAMNKID